MDASLVNCRVKIQGDNVNNCKVTLLSPKYLSNNCALKELSYWLHVMKRPQGWHYDMDEAWILENIEKAKLKKGATILDAGAGLGVMQYVLAARGYNVVSLDFCKREVPKEAEGIFNHILERQDGFEYQHSYQKFIVHSAGLASRGGLSLLRDKLTAPHLLSRFYYKVKREMLHVFYRTMERVRGNNQYGQIKFVRAAFHNMPFEESLFDAVVSVSALEHADINLLGENISEMVRVAKPGAPILISTSAIGDSKDVFDEITSGWCFSCNTMSRFSENAHDEYKKYKDVELEILKSDRWRQRIDSCYFTVPESPFYKKRMTQLPYLPMGLLLTK